MKPTTTALLSVLLVCSGSAVFAIDYIFDTIDEKVIFEGSLEKEGKTMSFGKIIHILDPAVVEGAKFDVIHHSLIRGDTFSDEKILFYNAREDGIYLVATADKMGGRIDVLNTPSLELPLPVTVGAKWHKNRIEGGHPVDFDMEILSIDKSVEIGGKTETVVVVKAVGEIKLGAETHKIEKESYFSRQGRVYQVTSKYIDRDHKAVSSFILKEIVPPGVPPKGFEPAGSPSASDSVQPVEPGKTDIGSDHS
ncbi:hypothetical protein JXA40_07255 [bacterium]|nr:hypothetical protein [candidate division CSSED10-310 bacterium]